MADLRAFSWPWTVISLSSNVSMNVARNLISRNAPLRNIFGHWSRSRGAHPSHEHLCILVGRYSGKHHNFGARRTYSRSSYCAESDSIAEVGLSASSLGMDENLVSVLRSIHACPTQAVFYVAGGGLQVLSISYQSPQIRLCMYKVCNAATGSEAIYSYHKLRNCRLRI